MTEVNRLATWISALLFHKCHLGRWLSVSIYRPGHTTHDIFFDDDAELTGQVLSNLLDWPLEDTHLTRDADFGWPFGGSIEHTLFNLFHMGDVGGFENSKHFLNEFKDLRFVPLTYLHAILKDHNNVLSSVLCAMFGALLCCSWLDNDIKKKD